MGKHCFMHVLMSDRESQPYARLSCIYRGVMPILCQGCRRCLPPGQEIRCARGRDDSHPCKLASDAQTKVDIHSVFRRSFNLHMGCLGSQWCWSATCSRSLDWHVLTAAAPHLGELGVAEGDVLGGGLQRTDDVAQRAEALVDALRLLQRLPLHLAPPDSLRACSQNEWA